MTAGNLALTSDQVDGSGLNVAIVKTQWNQLIVDSLVTKCHDTLVASGVKVTVHTVPGSFELPLACKHLAQKSDIDAIIAIGVLIKGETMHFEYIADAVSHGLMRVQLDSGVPVIFGVLTCLTQDQAMERAGMLSAKGHNHGEDWALTAMEMTRYQCRK